MTIDMIEISKYGLIFQVKENQWLADMTKIYKVF